MLNIPQELEAKIDNLDGDLQSLINKLIKTNEKSAHRLDKIIKQSDAQQLSLIKLNNELKIVSETDKLTSLFNRLKCEEILTSLVTQHKSFKIMIIDVDNFKHLNEKFDILIANKVLVQLSKIIKKSLKQKSILGRWSGDTFMIIDENSTLDEIIDTAEEICDNVEDYFFDDVGQVTVSIGVASIPNKTNLSSIVKAFESALNKAKSNGKNQVSV